MFDLLYLGPSPLSEDPLLQDFYARELFAKMFSASEYHKQKVPPL